MKLFTAGRQEAVRRGRGRPRSRAARPARPRGPRHRPHRRCRRHGGRRIAEVERWARRWWRRSMGAGSTGSAWWSTAPTVRPAVAPAGACARSAPNVEVLHDGPDGTQHQRRLRLHPPRGAPAGRRPAWGRRWAWPSTATPIASLAVDATAGSIDGDQIIAVCAVDRRAARSPGEGHRGRDGDDQPGVPARHGRSTGSRCWRCRWGTGTCSRRSPTRASRSAASRAATSSSPTWRPLATGSSRPCSSSTWWPGRVDRWPSWPTVP